MQIMIIIKEVQSNLYYVGSFYMATLSFLASYYSPKIIIREDTDNPVNQPQLKANTCSWFRVQEAAIGIGFTSDLVEKVAQVFWKPITENSNAKTKRMWITFNT